jgi:Tol biopolymer transport system component
MASLDGGAVSPLGLKGIRPLRILDGALVYLQADGAVMAVPLDVAHQRVTGKPMPVLDPVPVTAALNGNSAVFVSNGGALVTGLQVRRAHLMWVGRDGVSRRITPELRDFSEARLSPDGQRIAVIVSDGSKSDVWIYDLDTGTLSRLTTAETVTSAEWTRDGSRVVYSAVGNGTSGAVWAQSIGGAAAPQKLLETPGLSPRADLSPDGQSLLLQIGVETGWDLQRVSLDSSHTFRDFAASRAAAEFSPRFSPDGRWAAIVTSESGVFEVYVRSYPEPTVKVQVSVGGGAGAVWSADGTRLYYASGTAIMEARLATTPGMRVVSRDTAFRQIRNAAGGFGDANFDVSRDGSRIVIPSSESTAYPLVVVPNWLTEFRQRLAASSRK